MSDIKPIAIETLMTIETFDAKVKSDTETLDVLHDIKLRIQSKLNHRRYALNLENDLICKCYIDNTKLYAHVRLKIFNGSFYHESLKSSRILIDWFAHSSKGEKDRIARFIANRMLEEYYKATYMDYSRKWDKAQEKLNSKGNYLKDDYMLSMRDFE